MNALSDPRPRMVTILAFGALCAVTSVAASETAGAPSPAESGLAGLLLENAITAAFVFPGFAILAVASRWMAAPAVAITLTILIGLSAWVSLEMWNSSNALDGLMLIVLMLFLPPIATAGALLDIGGRALVRQLR